jgi:hypothetical protein
VASVITLMKDNTEKVHRLAHRLAIDLLREHPACPIGSDTASQPPRRAMPPSCGSSMRSPGALGK